MATLQPIIKDFYQREKSLANEVFLRQPMGDQWKTYTWKEVGEQARKMVTVLRNKGLKPGDHIALSSKNCCHWVIADLAIMIGGYVSVPLYPNLNKEQLNLVLTKSDSKLLFAGKLEEWEEMSKGIPKGMPIISLPKLPGSAEVTGGEDWGTLIKDVDPFNESPLPELDTLWTILFTSGTTGSPKGVMLYHRNISVLINNERTENDLGLYQMKNPKFFSFLPMNHIAERVLVEIAAMTSGGVISFADSLDTFVKNLSDTQPTLFFAVPRIWTKFQQGVFSKMDPDRLNGLLKIPLLSSYIKRKIRKGLGLNNAQIFITAAAPTPAPLKRWYKKIGINLKEIYGMTETCGGITLMPKEEDREGTVGKVISNTQMKLDPESGEIIAKSAWNMVGYYKDEEMTNKVLRDGWIYTGDKGVVDQDGFLKIVGRTTDTFKSAKGKYILPVPIEDKLIDNEYIEQICVAGRGVPQPLALINLSANGKKEDRGEVIKSLSEHLEKVNLGLENHNKIQCFVITKEDWNIQNKLLTPTLKVRRGFIDEKYEQSYDGWFDQGEPVVFES